MKRFKRFLHNEKGAYSLVEASIIYPVVFLSIFVIIYLGLYILQLMTVSAYAQKIAILASREVSSPGYQTYFSGSRYSSSAVEADFDADVTKQTTEDVKVWGLTVGKKKINPFTNKIKIDDKVKEVKTRAYRYWHDPLKDEDRTYYKDFGTNLVKNNSIINGAAASDVKVKIDCENWIISQYITVDIEQELMKLSILDFFGIENPKISVHATSTVSDTDELVRNTDFAVDSIDAIAQNLGIDTQHIKKTVKDAIKKLGLIK